MMPPVPEALSRALDGEFELLRLLGTGNSAAVYLARERALGRLVAIKVMREELAADETARRRFEREARAAASLSEHPDVVSVHRYGRLPDETPYLVMRYVKGRTLEERIAAEGRLPVEEAKRALGQVAAALSAAHAAGIVHRDVRPGNVFWDDDRNRAYLSDFGIAAVLETSVMDAVALTTPGIRLGDPRYRSPEQLLDEPVTEQADVYQWGLLAFELLAGEGPFVGTSAAQIVRDRLTGTPRDLRVLRPEVPERLADLVHRALTREPNRRPRAADLVRVLDEGTGGVAAGAVIAPAGTAQPPTDLAEIIRRRVPQVVGLAIAFGVGLIGLVSALAQRYPIPGWAFDFSIATAIAVLLASAVVAWFHGEKGRQEAPPLEYALLGTIVLAWIGTGILLFLRA